MSQLVRLEGKHTWQNAHCAVVGISSLTLVLPLEVDRDSVACPPAFSILWKASNKIVSPSPIFSSESESTWSCRIQRYNAHSLMVSTQLRRWSLYLLVGFTDPYNYTYSESLWWKLFKNHKRTQIQRQRQWQRQRQRQRHIKSAWKPNICYIFEILMAYSFQIWW